MYVIKRIGVLSLAKIMGATGLLFGLVVGIPAGLIFMAMGAVGGMAAGDELGAGGAGGMLAGGVVGGILLMIAAPVMYGFTMFLGGLIYGLIINLVFGIAGGLELEIDGPQGVRAK